MGGRRDCNGPRVFIPLHTKPDGTTLFYHIGQRRFKAVDKHLNKWNVSDKELAKEWHLQDAWVVT